MTLLISDGSGLKPGPGFFGGLGLNILRRAQARLFEKGPENWSFLVDVWSSELTIFNHYNQNRDFQSHFEGFWLDFKSTFWKMILIGFQITFKVILIENPKSIFVLKYFVFFKNKLTICCFWEIINFKFLFMWKITNSKVFLSQFFGKSKWESRISSSK